jgi:hypothetical protein
MTAGTAQLMRYTLTDAGRVALGHVTGTCGLCDRQVASIDQHLAEQHPAVHARVVGRSS